MWVGARGAMSRIREDEVVLVHLGRRELARDDPAEQAVGDGASASEARLRAHQEPDDPTRPAIRYDT